MNKEQIKEIVDLVHGKGNYQVVNDSVYVYLTINDRFCKFICTQEEREYSRPYLRIFTDFTDFKKAIEEYLEND